MIAVSSEEVVAYAGTLLGNAARTHQRHAVTVQRIEEIIDHQFFRPVFQPFVDLNLGQIIGNEALTRFEDGSRPDLLFREAHSVGLGSALEATCVAAALRAAHDLPADIFVNVNFSPTALLDGRAGEVLAGAERPLVHEITEHDVISDYEAIAEVLGHWPGVKVVVDDMGADYNTLTHILQLSPDFVKFDISIVGGVDRNPVRNAMAAGVCTFAVVVGIVIMAEGVETPEEVEVLKGLGVTMAEGAFLALGYYFGRRGDLPTL